MTRTLWEDLHALLHVEVTGRELQPTAQLRGRILRDDVIQP